MEVCAFVSYDTYWLVQVPFRLTRMLVKAMEVSGIEGNFRSTCENVMQVLRTNKDSVMAMMEVNTRLLHGAFFLIFIFRY